MPLEIVNSLKSKGVNPAVTNILVKIQINIKKIKLK